MKECRGCHHPKSLDEFPPDLRSPDGKQARCRSCINEFMKIHYRDHPAEYLIRRAKARAAKKGFECSVTVADISPLPLVCPVFGVRLSKSDGQQNPNAYSLDRINNQLGYVPGNVAVISYRANRLKNDASADDLQAVLDWLRGQKA
jgi:hypothetical protein